MQSEENTLTIRQAIPETYFNELLYWRDNFDRGAWRVGDITNELYALLVANGMKTDKYRVYEIVAQIVGKSARSIRSYSEVAAFYPESIRQEYGVLPFSHFSQARFIKGEDGQSLYRDVLETSYSYMMDHGVPPSVDRLNQLLFPKENLPITPIISQPVPILESSLAPLPVLDGDVMPQESPGENAFVSYLDRASYHIHALTGMLESAIKSEVALTGNTQAMFKVAKALALLNEAKEDIANVKDSGYNLVASVISFSPPGIPAPRTSGVG